MDVASLFKKFHIISKISHSFNFWEKSKLTPRCTAPIYRVSHNRLPGCPGQPFLPVGQPKVDPWLPDKATNRFTICIYVYVVGQPKCLVGQPQFDTGCPTGQPVFKTNVKPWIYVLSMCKRKIKSVEGLLRYRPYKLMNIASLYIKFLHFFQRFLISSIFKKNKN